ncbi:glycerate kinase [Agrobacterium tumefaciens]|uniref:glycerate kinase n=1 Tax=Agrobacterium tumefaciens TaxID=358 RepID=UPI00287C15C6|nr:glycerate kinase [Agrobacterium tumefaciens]MDS7595447.1 glycerate kinase [Agrobacterium tumefaciens]
MKIVIAPDSYKESMDARTVASVIQAAFSEIIPDVEYLSVPMADGGEGTVDAVMETLRGAILTVRVSDPLGREVDAKFGFAADQKLAVIEMAQASGLELVLPSDRNALRASTYGTGQLIKAALDEGATRIIVGIGGSATTDAGAGALRALGAVFLDSEGEPIGDGGAELARLERIDLRRLDERIASCSLELATDVRAPLLGLNGAARVFAPQKGANPYEVEQLERGLGRFAEVMARDVGADVGSVVGGGAGGGIAAGLIGALGAQVRTGWELVADIVDLRGKMAGATLVITGEGRTDSQSALGKTPVGVASVAAQLRIPVINLAGSLGPGADETLAHGVRAQFDTVPRPMETSQVLVDALGNLTSVARNIASLLLIGIEAGRNPTV